MGVKYTILHVKNIATSVGYYRATYTLVPDMGIYWVDVWIFRSSNLCPIIAYILFHGMDSYYLYTAWHIIAP